MQVYLREVPIIASKGLLMLPLDDARLSPVDVEDIATIAFALLTQGGHQGRAFEITGPEALSMAYIATAIGVQQLSKFNIKLQLARGTAAGWKERACRHF